MMKNNEQLKSHLLRLFRLALVDDDFSIEEWSMLSSFAESRGLTPKEFKEFILNPVGEIVYPKKEIEKLDYLVDLSRMIWADGKATTEERELFYKFYDNFALPHQHKQRITEMILDKKSLKNSNKELIDLLLF